MCVTKALKFLLVNIVGYIGHWRSMENVEQCVISKLLDLTCLYLCCYIVIYFCLSVNVLPISLLCQSEIFLYLMHMI